MFASHCRNCKIQNISAQLTAQLAPSSKIISVSVICAKYGAETGEDARHSQTVASCRGYSETVLQCAEIVMTSPLLLCSYLRTRCPRAPPRSRRCSGGRIVSAHTAAPLPLPLHSHLLLQRRDCRGTHGRESAGSRSGTAGRCRWCGLHRGDSV